MPCFNCGGSGVRCCEFGADAGPIPQSSPYASVQPLHRIGDTYGHYMHRWEADAVARSFRKEGYSIGVVQVHANLFKVKRLA